MTPDEIREAAMRTVQAAGQATEHSEGAILLLTTAVYEVAYQLAVKNPDQRRLDLRYGALRMREDVIKIITTLAEQSQFDRIDRTALIPEILKVKPAE